MSKYEASDEATTLAQLKNNNPVSGNKTWLRHKATGESGLIDLMILRGDLAIDDMADELSANASLKTKSHAQWVKRINDHIAHLSTHDGDSRNIAAGLGGHNLKIEKSSSGKVYFCEKP